VHHHGAAGLYGDCRPVRRGFFASTPLSSHFFVAGMVTFFADFTFLREIFLATRHLRTGPIDGIVTRNGEDRFWICETEQQEFGRKNDVEESRRRRGLGLASVPRCPGETSAQPAGTREHRIVLIHPMSEDVEVLYGDPEKGESRSSCGFASFPGDHPPHRHPVTSTLPSCRERSFRRRRQVRPRCHPGAQDRRLRVHPEGTHVRFYSEGAIVQVHGVGPFRIHWRAGSEWHDTYKSLDDADAASIFRFKRGIGVSSPRGGEFVRI
jgi:hypothetical protein